MAQNDAPLESRLAQLEARLARQEAEIGRLRGLHPRWAKLNLVASFLPSVER
jgi:uncharacterized coiled-coil protein SlyX